MTVLSELVGELLGHNDGKVKRLAKLVAEIDSNLKDNLLSKHEYDSLMLDVDRYKEIINISNNVQLSTKINQMIELLIQAAKYAKF